MKLSHLSDEKLISETERLAQEHRTLLPQLLYHLQEIERRKLFSALGYKSLFDYAVKKLHLANDEAYRRIVAARVMKDIPQIAPKLGSGSLTLTHIGMANVVFRQGKLRLDSRVTLLQKIEGTTTREAERILRDAVPTKIRRDLIRRVQGETIEMRFSANEGLLEKIEIVKGIFAHSTPHLSNGVLFEKLCDLVIENRTKFAAPQILAKRSKSSMRKSIMAGGKCENCGSVYALEIDHRFPKSLGGEDTPENLRLLCRSCNQRAAIEFFGQEKMNRFLG